MALKYNDRVRETADAPGLSDFTLTGAVTGCQSFLDGIGDTNTCYYEAEALDADGFPTDARETGLGTVSASGLSRDLILESSNGDAKVNFSEAIEVFCTIPAYAMRKFKNVTASTSLGLADNNTSFKNTGAAALCIMDLHDAREGATVTFTVTSPTQGFKLDAKGSDKIRIGKTETIAGGTIQATQQGASITLEGESGYWYAVSVVGTWGFDA